MAQNVVESLQSTGRRFRKVAPQKQATDSLSSRNREASPREAIPRDRISVSVFTPQRNPYPWDLLGISKATYIANTAQAVDAMCYLFPGAVQRIAEKLLPYKQVKPTQAQMAYSRRRRKRMILQAARQMNGKK